METLVEVLVEEVWHYEGDMEPSYSDWRVAVVLQGEKFVSKHGHVSREVALEQKNRIAKALLNTLGVHEVSTD